MSNYINQIITGDCREVLRDLQENAIDCCITDPPYGLGEIRNLPGLLKAWLQDEDDSPYIGKSGFMGCEWDAGVPGPRYWREVYRVLKPGAYLLAFAGTRTWDLMSMAIRLADFEDRDTIAHEFGEVSALQWCYSQGFPKSTDISKQIDKRGGANIGWFGPWLREERQKRGITQKALAQQFPSKTGGLTGCVANWELGLNLPTVEQFNKLCEVLNLSFEHIKEAEREVITTRHDGGKRQVAILGTEAKDYDITAPSTPEAQQWDGWGTALKPSWEPILMFRKPLSEATIAANVLRWQTGAINIDDMRTEDDRWPANLQLTQFQPEKPFIYAPKASKSDRGKKNTHVTVKPTSLIRQLARMVTPPNGIILDPFLGSGSTAKSAILEGFRFVGIEINPKYVEMAQRRIETIQQNLWSTSLTEEAAS